MKDIKKPWLALWAVVYASFLILDLLFPGALIVSILKLGGLASAIFYAFLHFRREPLLLTALALTFVADLILAINHSSVWGVFSFCFVQFFHLLRFTLEREKSHGKKSETLSYTVPSLPSFYLLAILVIGIIAITTGNDMLIPYAAVYAVILLTNFVIATIRYNKQPRSRSARRLFLGFALFVACDICVAASFLAGDGSLPAELMPVAAYLAWVFYFPSQIFICTSGKSVVK